MGYRLVLVGVSVLGIRVDFVRGFEDINKMLFRVIFFSLVGAWG